MVSYPELQNFSSYNEHPDYEERQNEEPENGEKEKKEEKEPEKLRHICDPMCLLYAKNENHDFTITTNTSQHVEFFHSLIFLLFIV